MRDYVIEMGAMEELVELARMDQTLSNKGCGKCVKL